MGVRILIVLITAGLAAGSAVLAAPGETISSFLLSGNIYPVGAAMFRDAKQAYGVFDAGPGGELRKYTPAGTLMGSVTLPGMTRPIDADHSHLGAGYLTVLDGGKSVKTYAVATGSLVSSVAASDYKGYAYNAKSGYYYASADNYIYRFSKAGSLVGSFSGGPDAGTLAASPYYNGKAGDYVVVNPAARGAHPTRVYTGGGSFVASFTIRGPSPAMNIRIGAVAGDGYPASHGTTLWLVLRTDMIWHSAYQIDLGNASAAVTPASFGSVKALFR